MASFETSPDEIINDSMLLLTQTSSTTTGQNTVFTINDAYITRYGLFINVNYLYNIINPSSTQTGYITLGPPIYTGQIIYITGTSSNLSPINGIKYYNSTGVITNLSGGFTLYKTYTFVSNNLLGWVPLI
jgi:hypothetical protein